MANDNEVNEKNKVDSDLNSFKDLVAENDKTFSIPRNTEARIYNIPPNSKIRNELAEKITNEMMKLIEDPEHGKIGTPDKQHKFQQAFENYKNDKINFNELSNYALEIKDTRHKFDKELIYLAGALKDNAGNDLPKAEAKLQTFVARMEGNYPNFYNKNNPKPDLWPRDSNLVLAEKLARDMELLVNSVKGQGFSQKETVDLIRNQQSPQGLVNSKNEVIDKYNEITKNTKNDNRQIIFENRDEVENFQRSFRSNDFIPFNPQRINNDITGNLKKAIARNLEVIEKLASGEKVDQNDLNQLADAVKTVNPKFYDKVKMPKAIGEGKLTDPKAYNEAMRAEKGKGLKVVKRGIKSAISKAQGFADTIKMSASNFVNDIKNDGPVNAIKSRLPGGRVR